MFSSPYSPFFTSGLLSEPITDRAASPDVPLSPRRGSLPTDSASRSDQEHASAFYFTLQPRRDEHEFRSFLSLDLAESQSMRSASLKRKASSKKMYRFPRISEDDAPVPQRVPTPLRMRFSRDSLRTIPSPKPVPSIDLPSTPATAPSPVPSGSSSAPPRLPSLLPLPAIKLSMPPQPRLSVRTPFNLPLTGPSKRVSVATKATSSTVSTRARKINRSAALAALEGRSRSAPLLVSPQRIQQRNFMSMSDDEDDEDDLDFGFADDSFFNPLMEPEDMVLPLPSSTFLEAPRSAPLPPRPTEQPSTTGVRRQRTRTKKHASKEWFPLKSFMDLHNDDDTSSGWAWRSFIDVAHIS